MKLQFMDALRLNTQYLEQRPNSEDAQYQQLLILQYLGMHKQSDLRVAEFHARDGYNVEILTRSLQNLRDSRNAELVRKIVNDAQTRFGGSAGILYQSHRGITVDWRCGSRR